MFLEKMRINNVHQMSEYNCNVCCKTFKEFVLFEGHFTFNKKCRTQCGSFMQCYICPKKFDHFAELKYHLRSHRCSSNEITISSGKSQRDYRCQVCKSNCYNKGRLERHVKVHEYGKVKCKVCNIRFTHQSLLGHILQSHQKQEKKFGAHVPAQKHYLQSRGRSDTKDRSPVRRNRCHVCNANCYYKAQLEKHVSVHKYGKLKCEVCNIRFTKRSLLCHTRKFHPKIYPRLYHKRSQTYPCKFCKQQFSQLGAMKKHLRVHSSGNLKCQICNIRFTPNGLTRHNKRDHPELQANSIPLAYKIKKPQQQHQRTGDENTQKLGNEAITSYQCHICKIFYWSKYQLEHHEKCHSGAYKCQVCNISFTKQTLWRHLKQAHPTFKKRDVLKYSCIFCKIEYLTPQKLEEHLKVHSELQCEVSITKISFPSYEALAHLDLPQKQNISNTPEEAPADKHPVCIQPSTSSRISDDQDESIEEQAVENYTVEDIISHMKIDGRMLYLVKWAGFGPDDDTWDELSTLDKCPNFLKRLAIYTDKIKHFSTLTDLSCHKKKHSLYQEWIHPSNVILSIEKSQENVESSSINVGPRSIISIDADQSESQLFEQDINSNLEISNEKRDNFPIEVDSKYIADSDNIRISNEDEDNFPIEADSSISPTVPFDSDLVDSDCYPTLELSDSEECEELSLLERTATHEDVVDISSESEVEIIDDDNTDPFYCYFCKEKYYSLKDLGVHSKMCSTINNQLHLPNKMNSRI